MKKNYKESKKNFDKYNVIFKDVKNKTKITKNLVQQIIEVFKNNQIMSYCVETFKILNFLVKEIIKEFIIKENSKND